MEEEKCINASEGWKGKKIMREWINVREKKKKKSNVKKKEKKSLMEKKKKKMNVRKEK